MSASHDAADEWRKLPLPKRKALLRKLEEALAENPWEPFPDSPQEQAFNSEADILFYGGAAGGGKTDLEIGLALTQHKRSIIFRREYTQLQGIVDRVAEIVGNTKGYNGQSKIWKLPKGRRLEFGSCQHPGDEQAFQGRPHDLKCFDELPHFLESQFRFLCGWLRSSEPGQRCRVVAAGNPPVTPEEEWVVKYFAPWLDVEHANPAQPGELRWFTTVDGKDVERPNGEPFELDGEIVQPLSRTVIFANVDDNPIYRASGYKAMLQALPEPLRSKMLKGDFHAGKDDNPWQVIPTEWVRRAQARWKERGGRPEEGADMDTLGVDVTRGGKDKFVMSPRTGTFFHEQIVVPGREVDDGPKAVALIEQARSPTATVCFDVVGVGSSVADIVQVDGIPAVPLNGAAACKERDRNGRLGFVNLRACLYWRMREALDPENGDDIALPPDRELLVDLCAPRWKLTVRGIQVESKDDIIKRIQRSPDKGDAAVYALFCPAPQIAGIWPGGRRD